MTRSAHLFENAIDRHLERLAVHRRHEAQLRHAGGVAGLHPEGQRLLAARADRAGGQDRRAVVGVGEAQRVVPRQQVDGEPPE